ncbi:putative cytosolic purine 5-nucleotidase [Haematococcus lacustris]
MHRSLRLRQQTFGRLGDSGGCAHCPTKWRISPLPRVDQRITSTRIVTVYCQGSPAPLTSSPASGEDGDPEAFKTEAGTVLPVSDDNAEVDYLGESTEGNLHLIESMKKSGVVNVFGIKSMQDIYTLPITKLKKATQAVLDVLSVPESFPEGNPQRAIYCSRTLNLRSIKAIGYDMDYTLIHYSVDAWEGRAFAYGLDTLRQQGVPVDGLQFDPNLVIRGLIMDKEKGNLIKADRFGLVKRAMHGTRMLSWQAIREEYGRCGREVVNLRNEGRWVFLNTLFSVSEAVMYVQLVDRLDQGAFNMGGPPMTYQSLYALVAKALYRTHVEGKLKAEIIQAPEKYVELDPGMAQTLLDQRDSGKQLLLITNSDYQYTDRMMTYAYTRYLPQGMGWRDLFDMVIVNARKPDFFNQNMSLYEVVTEDGLMRPVLDAKKGGLFCGGSARMVEKALGVEGDDVLYVGDHIYTDAALAKINFRWRTALIIRELEEEIDSLALGRPHRDQLKEMMNKKELVGDVFNQLRLARQRFVAGHNNLQSFDDEDGVNETLAQLLMVMEALDESIGPMLEQDGQHFNSRWGYLSRAGLNDKSQLCRQIEKYADLYTSRVSNFLRYTPYMYFRSPSQSLAHDRNLSRYYQSMLHGNQQDSDGDDHEFPDSKPLTMPNHAANVAS